MSHLAHYPVQLYCRQLTDLFQQAIAQPNPAWWLYKHQARSPLFMAESLGRVLAGATQSKKAEKACALFKKLEDLLGKIDDYDHLAQEYGKYNTVKAEEVNYFLKKRNKCVDKLNDWLVKKEFYQRAFFKVEKKLAVDFNDRELVMHLREQIRQEIEKCWRFYSIFSHGFTDMEGQVHEIRRKLRWISIYAESFNGLIVLEKTKATYGWEKTYISKEAKDDPFNSLVLNKNFQQHIVFHQKAFYAFNKVIADLGHTKNKGLQIEFLAKAIRKTYGVPHEDADAMALKQLKVDYTVKDLLQEAHVLLHDFFETQAIHKLLV